MKYLNVLLVCVFLVDKRVAADSAIAKGLVRAFLMKLGPQIPDGLPDFGYGGSQIGYEQALGYYENATYEETTTFDTSSGPIKGAKFAESYAFYSIPFAEPPKRFQAPVPLTNPLPAIDATKPDIVVCQQLPKNCTNGVCTQNTNEDCLVLNIHVPLGVTINENGATTSVRPVLVWFHGGGFFTGSGTLPEFEARYFAEQTDAVIVSVNYRLGAFGFLVHGEGENAIEGNFGMKDQQLALQWVNSNIRKFGGDPELVTIFGNSAGAQSVMLHLVSESSKPYFSRAIMESNPAVFQYQTLEEAKRVSARLVKILNCSGTTEEEQKCLMEADASTINQALPLVMAYSLAEDQDLFSTIEAFRPVLDGVEFTKQPFENFREGNWNTDKDVIVGTNANELEIIQYYMPIPLPEPGYRALNRFLFGNQTGDMISDRYIQDYVGPRDYRILLGIEASHMFFMCPSRLMTRFASATSTSGRVYLYNNIQPMDGPTCQDVFTIDGVCGLSFHGSEPPFVFRSGPFYGYDFRQSDKSAADQFDYYWTNFAATGNPSDTGSIANVGHTLGPFQDWPQYSDQQTSEAISLYRSRLGIQERSTSWQNIIINGTKGNSDVQDAYLENICDFWDSLNYYIDLSATPVETTKSTTVNVNTTPKATTTAEATTSASKDIRSNILVLFLSSLTLANIAMHS